MGNMRYDDTMNRQALQGERRRPAPGIPLRLAACLALVALAGVACRRQQPDEEPDSAGSEVVSLEVTVDPALAMTLQAEAAATAAWVAQLTPVAAATDEPFPTLSAVVVAGTPPAELTGPCPVPDDYALHVRAGFCLAAPEAWTPFNVDGGLAAFLGTTPGQAISIRPDWATSPAVCDLMIYIGEGDSPLDLLRVRHDTFERRSDLAEISPVAVQPLGEIALLGFTWASTVGEAGGVFVDTVAINRLVHITYSGSQCAQEDLLPALNTLRFNQGQ
jgi:hypothetical protein